MSDALEPVANRPVKRGVYGVQVISITQRQQL
jgi:hypothetical protein